MRTINKVILVGRLTKDPELKKTNSDLSFVRFTVTTDRRVGQGKDPVSDFIDCEVWGAMAESLAKYTKKGDLIGVEGSIQVNKYQDKDGNTRYSTRVRADAVHFLGSKGGTSPANGNAKAQNQSQEESYPDDYDDESLNILSDEDVPF